PEKNPLFFEKRVYQGSCGKVYPVPFIDKVHDTPVDVAYQAARLENEYVRLVMLPEIGGRILLGQDKTNADYDFFYRQDVIKPALVGLAGPWISGGVEFNWPQHHRPGTFMPADVFIENESDGARTVWMSEHDPLNRMKGMHGLRLRPGSSVIELRGRLYNRTPYTQTFLWWANVAARVHDRYQSFFPPDVTYVADHAVRAVSSFPEARNPYYGIDYAARPGANDLTWYKNIPVPTSYMVCGTQFDFFGGYDHATGGGFVHVADRHVAPGKKQWTWGDHAFGHAWDRELTDANGPYIELMAGVYTDNQPDFSYLLPYETKTFSQFWWPIQGIGPVQAANTRAALRLVVRADRAIEVGLNVSSPLEGGRLVLTESGRTLLDTAITLRPGEAWKNQELRLAGDSEAALHACVYGAAGEELLAYRPVDVSTLSRDRQPATEPAPPETITSSDELFLIGEHLEQYRHPTRSPELYWAEALRRDPGDCRCHVAMGRRRLAAGELGAAASHFERAVVRLTGRHPNPVTGEAHYYLGLTRDFQGDPAGAYALLSKAAWNYEWRAAAHYRLACIDCRLGRWSAAGKHLADALATNADLQQARVLQAALHRRQGRAAEAERVVGEVLRIDPLDHAARAELARLHANWEEFLRLSRNDAQTVLDLVFDLEEAGLRDEAIELLEVHHAAPTPSAAVPNPAGRSPMTAYVLAWLRGDDSALAKAREACPDRFFPSRPAEMRVLDWAIGRPGRDPVASYALGNLLYDRRRHEDAIQAWQRAVAESPNHAQAQRNLGLALWNVRRDGAGARRCYLAALRADPADPRLVSEYDQLCAKLNDEPAARLAFLEARRELVLERDDCTVSFVSLLNLVGRSGDALDLLTSRRFHPWEGGEGAVLRQFTAAKLALGRAALDAGKLECALDHFQGAMCPPAGNLGEAYHPLQAKADVNYWVGRALRALGREVEAKTAFQACAKESGDFADMAVTAHSTLSFYRGLALRELGLEAEATTLFRDLRAYAEARLREKARIDYFATSLPNLLVFEEDLQARSDAGNHLLAALAAYGLGENNAARESLARVMSFNRSHPEACALASLLAAVAQG
ncbi:MAG: DUF5107 domain-containing protein, partial [Opitutaceae bacterium]|nr:DUF5107 domain-containing protein [Opitutaceae bacterium]